jgi:NhaP-type Na+/H+ or K+/H+ antiporter
MGTEAMLIGISAAVLLSYWFSHLGRQLRFPSVIFLIATGIVLRELTDFRGATPPLPKGLLPLLGTVGLILIVLEGALDLDLQPGRRRFLLRTFGAAAVGVASCAAVLAAALAWGLDLPWSTALLIATPFAVISSAVAIPSAEVLSRGDREFVIYESSWSDILGVMLFNAALVAALGGGATLNFFGGGFAVLVMGSLIGLAVYWLVGHLEGHVKFLPLIFALILVYAGAKALHLSPLLIVLILGLMLNNPHLLRRVRWLDRLHSDHYGAELDKLKHLTAEATFLVRTFFFLLLGYSTDVDTLADPLTWAVAAGLVLAIFGLRWPLLWLFNGRITQPLLWAAPRGLITVLLFYSLPPGVVPAAFPEGALILVVLLSCVVMAVGLRRDAPGVSRAQAGGDGTAVPASAADGQPVPGAHGTAAARVAANAAAGASNGAPNGAAGQMPPHPGA